MKSDFALKYCR